MLFFHPRLITAHSHSFIPLLLFFPFAELPGCRPDSKQCDCTAKTQTGPRNEQTQPEHVPAPPRPHYNFHSLQPASGGRATL